MTVRVQIRAETFLGKVLGIRRRLKITVYIAPMKRFDALARIHCRSVVRKTVANCKMIDSKTSKVFPLACHADFHVSMRICISMVFSKFFADFQTGFGAWE